MLTLQELSVHIEQLSPLNEKKYDLVFCISLSPSFEETNIRGDYWDALNIYPEKEKSWRQREETNEGGSENKNIGWHIF